MTPLRNADEHAPKRSLKDKSAKFFSNRTRRMAEQQRCKPMELAEEEGINVGHEKLYCQVTLISSVRGVIRQDEPDYKEKLAQWQQAKGKAIECNQRK